jgi:hypothetical protein
MLLATPHFRERRRERVHRRRAVMTGANWREKVRLPRRRFA